MLIICLVTLTFLFIKIRKLGLCRIPQARFLFSIQVCNFLGDKYKVIPYSLRKRLIFFCNFGCSMEPKVVEEKSVCGS